MIPEWGYSTGQKYYDRLGTETFLVASPGNLILYTQSAEVIHRMTQRREAFPKDISLYGILSMFGQNVLTTEGSLWRMHRKITSASFNEKNAAHTFAEVITQTQGMLNMWFGPEGEQTGTTKTLSSLEHDTMTWALNIIGYVGFGLRLLWPGQSLPKDIDPKLAKYGSLQPPPGHTMTFADSLAVTLERIVSILLYPTPVLSIYTPLLCLGHPQANPKQGSSRSSSPKRRTKLRSTTSSTWTNSCRTRGRKRRAAPSNGKAWT